MFARANTPPLGETIQIRPKSTTEYDRSEGCSAFGWNAGGETRLLTDEGYVTFSGTGTPIYHYYLRDHLGNVRVVMGQTGAVEQVNHYYAFGGLMRESASPGLQPYKYGGKELDRYAGLDAYDFGARSYFADRMQWSTMDPLCEKYYDVSPYAYCLDNPVKYIDPDGKEKLNFFNKEDDNSMYMGAQRAYNDNAIHVFAHGNESSILPFNNITGIVETIDNPEAFIKFLEQNSDTWKTTKDKSKLTIVLHSCKTGRGEKSFAALLSRELKDITIIAPDNNDYINDRGESGVYVSERDNNKMNKKTNVNDAKKGKQTENKRTSIKGSWNIFKNGTIVDSYDGTWVPKEKPSWTDRFLHH